MLEKNDYLRELKKRAKKSHIYRSYQFIGLEIASLLRDEEHKSLYIKLAKEKGSQKLLPLAKSISQNGRVRNKGAYFMTALKATSSAPLFSKTNEKLQIKLKTQKLFKRKRNGK